MLSPSDVYNLRLVCVAFSQVFWPQIRRVFLSLNPLDIAVLLGVARHDYLRHFVTELIWDDSQMRLEWDTEDGPDDRCPKTPIALDDEPGPLPKWFQNALNYNLCLLGIRLSGHPQLDVLGTGALGPSHDMSTKDCWVLYKKLLRDQKIVSDENSDLHAFSYAIERFPSLKRVEVTPSAHGSLFTPLYPTPTIRSFPKSFNYPIPSG